MNRKEWEVCKVAHAPFPTEQGMGNVISMATEKLLSRITLVELMNACFYPVWRRYSLLVPFKFAVEVKWNLSSFVAISRLLGRLYSELCLLENASWLVGLLEIAPT